VDHALRISVNALLPDVRSGSSWNKKLVGVKRHILVDTEGFLLSVVVHSANIPDRTGGQRVLQAAGGSFPRLQHIWVDQGYTGTLVRWAAQEHGWTVQVVYPTNRQFKRYAPTARGSGLLRAARQHGGGAHLPRRHPTAPRSPDASLEGMAS
jgi:transposase